MRKTFVAALAAAGTLAITLTFGVPAGAGQSSRITGDVWKSPTCGCCKAWVAHMQTNGIDLAVTETDTSHLNRLKTVNGIPEKYASCHTARIAGYTIEGHVPADAVRRLLAEKPDAIGLSVPGMPAGSPGMEADGTIEPYDVLLVRKDGTADVFAHYPAKP